MPVRSQLFRWTFIGKLLLILYLFQEVHPEGSSKQNEAQSQKSQTVAEDGPEDKEGKSPKDQDEDAGGDNKTNKKDKKDKKKKKTKRDKELEREEVTALGRYRNIRYRGKYKRVKSKAFDLYHDPIPYSYSDEQKTRYNWFFSLPEGYKRNDGQKMRSVGIFYNFEMQIYVDKLNETIDPKIELKSNKRMTFSNKIRVENIHKFLYERIEFWQRKILKWLEVAVSTRVTSTRSRTITVHYDVFGDRDAQERKKIMDQYVDALFEAADKKDEDPSFDMTAFLIEKMGDDAKFFKNLRIGNIEDQVKTKVEKRENVTEGEEVQENTTVEETLSEEDRTYVKGRWELVYEEPPIYPENLDKVSYSVERDGERLKIIENHILKNFRIYLCHIELLLEGEVGKGKMGFVFSNREYLDEKHGLVVVDLDKPDTHMYDFFDMIIVFRRHRMKMIRQTQTPIQLIWYMKSYLEKVKKIHLMEIELGDISFTKKEKKKKEEEDEVEKIEEENGSENKSTKSDGKSEHPSQEQKSNKSPKAENSKQSTKEEDPNQKSKKTEEQADDQKSKKSNEDEVVEQKSTKSGQEDDAVKKSQKSGEDGDPEQKSKKSGQEEDADQKSQKSGEDTDEDEEESEPAKPLDDIDYQASLKGQKILELRRMANLINMKFYQRERGDNEDNVLILYNDEHWFKIRIERFKNQYLTIKLSNGYGDYYMTYNAIMNPEKLDEVVHHVLFYVSNKIYQKNIAGCVWIMREVEKIFSIYPIENDEKMQDYWEMKTEVIQLKKRLDSGEIWKMDLDPKEIVKFYEEKRDEREGKSEDQEEEVNSQNNSQQEDQSQKQNENEGSQKQESASQKQEEDADAEEETNQKKINRKKKEGMMYEQDLQTYYEAKLAYIEENKPDFDEAKYLVQFPNSSHAFEMLSNAMNLYVEHKVSHTGLHISIFYFEDSSLPGVLLQIESMENDFEYYIPLGDRYEITSHIRNIAKDLDEFFSKLVEEETKPVTEFMEYKFDDVKKILVSKLTEGKTKLCVIEGDDVDQPLVPEMTEDLQNVKIHKQNQIFQLGDAEALLESESTTCPEDHKPRIAVSLSQKKDSEGGAYTLRFIFPKCKNRLGSDFNFRPIYPYDHKPLLEAFIQENIEVLQTKCKPEKVYVPGMTLFDDDDESEEEKKDDKKEEEGGNSPKDEQPQEERILNVLPQI